MKNIVYINLLTYPIKKKKVINYIFIKKIVYGTMDGHSINIYIYIYIKRTQNRWSKKKKNWGKKEKRKRMKSQKSSWLGIERCTVPKNK